ncbi:bifunctional folylpolyglutamate synthase/dihydrofolate synthase [Flavisolibacter ginsenosidimutans]|uniref:Dihydrofolate synthase/folylpolyglutamate synthase n=1 Tax=Flavisolibacter ginsenosidimutans TaxID=661481 RepID=A0A5B8UEK7_9BACT|nr:folylpolyglutamate synthase/dihydrofolate synthase family protein [Flavisolibacter ginsenosidimutans]QEC55097.1 bifunctional folylpolyglutamate synthase/dihydrofolate synthase [Flavisolibacter ginsenosidimutans]
MTYAETLDYLYNALPMFSRMGSAAFKKDLTNVKILCERLGNPHQRFKSIHIAGTNGKGSVSHMLAAIFQKAGYKTGLYTSPHLYDFRERIRINGKMVPEEFVVRFTEEIKPLIESVEPSFFEITVAMAFQFFAEQKVDVAVIEVGLGGRLDSTNIITPALSVITNIGWDHMNMLGKTLQEIAAEKAGIIKESVPVVIGETLPETKPVFQKVASEKAAPVFFAEESFEEVEYSLSPKHLHATFKRKEDSLVSVETDLPGLYQLKNLRTVLTAIDVLNKAKWNLRQEIVAAALSETKATTGLQGRWEIIHQHPTVVLDVAHNKNGIEQMLQHIARLSFRQLHIVFGMVKDKDAESLLSLLPSSARYYFTQANIPRALPATELKEKAEALCLVGDNYPDVNEALKAALRKAVENDLVLVCGSIFLVAEVNRHLFAVRRTE